MKIFVAFLFAIACLAGVQAEDPILEALEETAKDAKEAKALLININDVSIRTQVALTEQQESLKVLDLINTLVGQLSTALDIKSQETVAALLNISKEGEEYASRTEAELLLLARLQEGTALLINQLTIKMEAYQQHVLDSSRKIDQDINGLAKLITRTVLPHLNGLKCSLDNLETSQINVEVELKDLAGIRQVSESTNRKLDVLEQQLKQLNHTQEVRLDGLTTAVNHLQPLNTWKVEGALRELIISQKRIELDLEQCSRPSHYPHHGHHEETYAPSYGFEPSYSPPEPQYTPQKPEPVDLVQVWNIKEPQKQGEQPSYHQVRAYAQSPEPKKHYPVSRREPLPWEAAQQYDAAPALAHRPVPVSHHQPTSNPHHEIWNPAPVYASTSEPQRKPCPKEQQSLAPSYGPILIPQQSYKPEPQEPHNLKPYEPQSYKQETRPEPHKQERHPDQPHKPQEPINPQSHHGKTYRASPVQPGESYRIWYADESLPKGY
ncbi:uncharacterized protein Dana_GF14238 [Drosophila ananassae]|uniref:Uncharacterized protein n=1 Tax=Drosophila ananassae TaxID=7217 RepID=B3MN61_DROAN|nr:proteoglycan 4 [Drosophila ananassae]EDV32039.1 uncharacterized protein Dana_GF14238 [Drosophila ananassae]